ncbi:Crp/Fnr family transcriptional regulator [Piscinibacter sakaiensis]|uniref:cAMP-binding protein n=1 Tax=Piscinibacter sakaiensis TaxID=1547922 RepID=A0A0K8P4T4_PISS1|nr:Crp/Fnr family transcriptional regulator [Piscinibacter sakaiensis]GAP37160.1 cAMP-binding protein [Piscinibacter sakaiensis]
MSPLLRALAARGVERRYRKGTVLMEEGDPGGALYVILAGRVRVFSRGEREREITYGIYGAGDYLGEMSLDGGPRSASAVTLEASRFSAVSREVLEAFVAEHPAFAFELLTKVIRRARAATLSTKQLALNDVYGRLRAVLDELARPEPGRGERRIAAPPTHLALSQRLGCSREMVSRLLADLVRGGYIVHGDGAWWLPMELPPRW